MESTSYKSKFLAQINKSFGSGGMSLALNEVQFSMFIQFLKQDSAQCLTISKAVTRIGQQDDTELWVLGECVQVDAHGQLISQEDLVYTWLDWSVQQGLGNVSLKEVLPTICLPLNTTILHRAVKLLQAIMKHNFIASTLMVAGAVMTLHYSSLVQHSTGCPTIVAVGPSQSGKSTALRVALSIVGMLTQMQLKLSMTPNICNPWRAFLLLHFSAFIHIGLAREAIYERVTNAFILERAAASTLPFAVGDPAEESSKQCNIGDIIVDLHNGGRTGSMRKGLTCAASAPLIPINHELPHKER